MREEDRESAVDALRDFNFEVQAFREAVAGYFDVGVREAQAAAHLVTHGHLSAGELSRHLGLTPATITNLLERLDRAGLATTAPDPADLRRSIVSPTDQARAMIDQIRGWLGSCLDAFADTGTPLDVVVHVLAVLRDELLHVRSSLRNSDGVSAASVRAHRSV